jgi:hypothetical protein
MTRHIGLTVNDQAIELDYFLQGFIDHTVGGMLSGLEGTEEISTLDLSVDGDRVTINLNGSVVPANPFVNQIIKGTLEGMVSSLKGVGAIIKINIIIKR